MGSITKIPAVRAMTAPARHPARKATERNEIKMKEWILYF